MKISVCMPTYNRAKLIPHAIYSLMRQKRKPDEILVIDDGSTDDTKDVIKKLNDKYKIIKYIYRDSPLWVNPSVPLNVGIKQASGDLILFSLSDIIHVGETIEYIEKRHEMNDLLYLIGSTIYWIRKDVKIPPEYWENPDKITHMGCVVNWYNGIIAKDNEITRQEDLYTSNIASCRKKHLIEVGGFDEDLTDFYGHEDSEITERLYNNWINENKATSDFNIERDNSIVGIHQYHERPPSYATVGTTQQGKKVSDKLKNNPHYNRANVGKEWGKI